jgi:nanoRNase/pAp phosphatase (c-di-AMP/oligoRNAs hydrolase)
MERIHGEVDLDLLLDCFDGRGTVLILPHNNPDPDSLASAFAMRCFLTEMLGLKSIIRFGGLIGRAENKAMIKHLGIPVGTIRESDFKRYKYIVLVDTQPDAGNNSLPAGMIPTVVFDHHPPRKKISADYLDIRPGYGATITIIWEYLKKAGIKISPDLATAIAYAIGSETQDLGREASPSDKKAYLEVFPQSSLKKLSNIYHPKLTWEYFEVMHKAISNTSTKRHIIYCNLKDISNPDFVHQVADLLLRVERKSWSLAMGRSDGILFFSLRTTRTRAFAGKLHRKVIGKKGSAGGHDMMAGGRIEYGDLPISEVDALEEEILQKFLKLVK